MENRILNSSHVVWQMKRTDRTEWNPARVPGSVYDDLQRAGLLPDPYDRDNQAAALEAARFDYEYQASFSLSARDLGHSRLLLRCLGLDTLCTITLNDMQVAQTDDMHRVYEFDVKPLLRVGANRLHFLLRSPVEYVLAKEKEFHLESCADAVPGISYLRKGQSMFGWDWGAQLPDLGIWRGVSLCLWDDARFSDVGFRQFHGEDTVRLEAEISVERISAQPLRLEAVLAGPDGGQLGVQELALGQQDRCRLQFEIKSPKLWWPNGWGEQPLYRIALRLLCGAAELEQRVYRIGLRTLLLRREPDQWGESFAFEVNGRPLFAMGANYIPEDHILARKTPERTRALLQSCRDAHYNMVRVWGGGCYPDDEFLDLCDEMGLLVWQDHLYACGIYHFDETMWENVAAELRDNVTRIRHHPSLCLWSGNNECAYGWAYWGWQERFGEDLKREYLKQFEEVLPALSARYDPDTCYIPSSPTSGRGLEEPNAQDRGDMHYWEVWHERKPFEAYREIYGRFLSEFGIQSFPGIKTVNSFTREGDRNIFSYVMEAHQKNGTANGKILHYISEYFKYPKDLTSLLYVSQLVQGIGMQCGVEHWRRNRGRCMGSLYWQLNDCWPVASWSSIDYYGRWKASHYLAKRFFEPCQISCLAEGEGATLFFSNESLHAARGTVGWMLFSLSDGQPVQRGECPVQVPALSAQEAVRQDFSALLPDAAARRAHGLAYWWNTEKGERRSCGCSLFVKPKHAELRDPKIQWSLEETETEFLIRLHCTAFACFVWLDLREADGVFSDNAFHLIPGIPRAVSFRRRQLPSLSAADFAAQLKVSSLYDTFLDA